MPITPRYVPGSIEGTILAHDFQTGFRVYLDGVHDAAGPKGTTHGLHPMLAHPATQPAGQVFLSIRLSSPTGTPQLVIEANTTTPTQGVMLRRAPRAIELQALFAHWWGLRDAILAEHADRPKRRAALADIFTHHGAIPGAKNWRTKPYHAGDPACIVMEVKTPGTLPIPPIPTLAARPAPTSPLHQALQDAIAQAEGELSQLGNGYAWTVGITAPHLLAALAPFLPDLDPSAFVYAEEDE